MARPSPVLLCVLATLSGWVWAAPASARDAPVRAELEETPYTAVAECIRLLEAKDYRGYVTRYFPPGSCRLGQESLDLLADEVARTAPGSLRTYRLLLSGRPANHEVGVRLTAPDPATGGTVFKTFRKVGGKWYEW